MSFEIALSGINAINSQLDTISNNIANTGTYGFKSSRANFASMYAGAQPTGTEVGSLTQSIDIGGGVVTTGRGLDAAIQGRGFFVTRDSSGATLFTRVGIFAVDKEGFVVDGFGRKVQGYAAAQAGALGAMGDITVPTGQIPASASGSVKYVGNLSADWTAPAIAAFDPTVPQSFNASTVTVAYDSLGAQHTVTQYFVRGATNEVNVYLSFDGAPVSVDAGGQPLPTATLAFGSDGQLVSPVGAVPVALGTPAGADPLTVAIDYTGTTQFAGEATTTVNAADGYASGTLIGVQLSEDGAVMAQYSNGQKVRAATIALATFPSENALVPASDTSWTVSNASGDALYFAPGSGMAGKLTPGALEQSNVDMTSELVTLMSAQRNYQANTKVISTENEMVQTLMQAL
ncbi:flagellar hook protein FlgE [Aromatoleum sp.]|uniref:flagellar hook protein FlgE n=1 Tax=Aromatoleum sp. TaxID=2307007 RepID=UPI002FC87914